MTIQTIFKQHIGGVTEKKDQPEWTSDGPSVGHSLVRMWNLIIRVECALVVCRISGTGIREALLTSVCNMNDKGRYRQQPESTALEAFKRSHLRPRFRVDHSLHPEVFVCSRCSAQLFGQTRGQAETESVPVRLLNRGTGGRKYGEGRVAPGCLYRLVRRTASPRTRLRLPSHLRVAPFLPSEPA